MDVVGGAEDSVGAGLIGGARQHHEVGVGVVGGAGDSVRTWIVERIVVLERNEDRATAALGDEIEAVIEELAEERHPGVERRRQSCVRRLVREEEDFLVVGGAEHAIQAGARDDFDSVLQDIIGGVENAIRAGVVRFRIGRRVVGGLVDDQVADRARLRVEHVSAGLLIGRRGRRPESGRGRFRVTEERVRQPREHRVGRAELGLPVDQVVVRPIDGAQAERHPRVREQREQILARRVPFRDDDLIENELQVGSDEVHAGTARPNCRRVRVRPAWAAQ